MMDLPEHPQVTVIVCTYDRLADLREVLDDLLAQTYNDYEILVVDNNSTDGTAEYVQALTKTAPRVRYCLEPRQGKSFALNRAIQEAQGDIMAFTDDDCQMPPGWLEVLVTAYRETQADAVGGPARPRWEGEPSPLTLKLYGLGVFPATFDRGNRRRPVDWLIGCNMSFRQAVFDRVTGFNTEVGPKGRGPGYGEEVDFCARAGEAGCEILYDPDVWIWHKVPRQRQSLSYVLRSAFRAGGANARVHRPVNVRAAWTIHPLKVLVNIWSLAGRLYDRTAQASGPR